MTLLGLFWYESSADEDRLTTVGSEVAVSLRSLPVDLVCSGKRHTGLRYLLDGASSDGSLK